MILKATLHLQLKNMTRYLLIILFLYSCAQKPKHLDPYRWYEHTKTFILSASNSPTDSTSTEKYQDGRTPSNIARVFVQDERIFVADPQKTN